MAGLLDVAQGISDNNISNEQEQSFDVSTVNLISMFSGGHIPSEISNLPAEDTDEYKSYGGIKVLKEPNFEIGDYVQIHNSRIPDAEYAICVGKAIVATKVGLVYRNIFIPTNTMKVTMGPVEKALTIIQHLMDDVKTEYQKLGTAAVGDLSLMDHCTFPVETYELLRDYSKVDIVFSPYVEWFMEESWSEYTPTSSLISVAITEKIPTAWKTKKFEVVDGVECIDWCRRFHREKNYSIGQIIEVVPSDKKNTFPAIYMGKHVVLYNNVPWITNCFLPCYGDLKEDSDKVVLTAIHSLKQNIKDAEAGRLLGENVRIKSTWKKLDVTEKHMKFLTDCSTANVAFGSYAGQIIYLAECAKKYR